MLPFYLTHGTYVLNNNDVSKMVDKLMGGECETSHEVWKAMKATGWTGSIREVQNIMLDIQMTKVGSEKAVISTE